MLRKHSSTTADTRGAQTVPQAAAAVPPEAEPLAEMVGDDIFELQDEEVDSVIAGLAQSVLDARGNQARDFF
jgi:hypothetical protein